MRIGYADPPYIGCAHLYPEKREVDHVDPLVETGNQATQEQADRFGAQRYDLTLNSATTSRDVRDLLEDMLATIPGDDGRAFVQAYLDRFVEAGTEPRPNKESK